MDNLKSLEIKCDIILDIIKGIYDTHEDPTQLEIYCDMVDEYVEIKQKIRSLK